MVRDRDTSRTKAGYIVGIGSIALILVWLVGCSATRGHSKALQLETQPLAIFDLDNERFTSFDGAELGLTVWQAEGTAAPELVVVGVHGMNDYAMAFEYAGQHHDQ